MIAAVTGFSLFVELQDPYIEGLVHISALPQDYYQFDPAHQRLVGERSRRVYQLGDSLKVQVLSVDLDERKVDLGLVQGETKRRRKPSLREALAKGQVPKSKPGKAPKAKRGAAGKKSGAKNSAAKKGVASKKAAANAVMNPAREGYDAYKRLKSERADFKFARRYHCAATPPGKY